MTQAQAIGPQRWASRFQKALAYYLRAGEPGVARRIDQMCAATGLDRSRVYAWRSGRSLPNAYAIALMAEWFGAMYPDFTAGRLLGLEPLPPTREENQDGEHD